jgi:hypothetical protein
MSKTLLQARRHAPALAALVIALGFVAEAHGYPPQRRGRMVVPQQPTIVDSAPMVDDINKALKALEATDRDYDGHREKAIAHLHNAIRDVKVPTAAAKGKSNAAAAKAAAEQASAAAAEAPADTSSAKTPTVSQADSDALISKALKVLFALHRELDGKAATKGQIHARAEVKIAIDELVAARKVAAAAAAPASATVPGSAPASAPAAAKPQVASPKR